jgi:hypothetical protein
MGGDAGQSAVLAGIADWDRDLQVGLKLLELQGYLIAALSQSFLVMSRGAEPSQMTTGKKGHEYFYGIDVST